MAFVKYRELEDENIIVQENVCIAGFGDVGVFENCSSVHSVTNKCDIAESFYSTHEMVILFLHIVLVPQRGFTGFVCFSRY